MPTRPALGLVVVVERSGMTWLEAEVTAYDGSDVLLTVRDEVPADDGDQGAEPETTVAGVPIEATLVWTTERGLFRARVTACREPGHRLDPAADSDPIRWRLAFRAQVDRTQRREYLRLPMGTPMTLSHDGRSIRGTLIDLSEAALRARLPLRQSVMRPGEEVRAAFTLHRTGFVLRGTVLREQDAGDSDAVDVVVMLDIPARTANDLRRHVVFEQAERQSARGPKRPDPS